MSSQSVNVWAKTESIAERKYRNRLKVGNTMDTIGGMPKAPIPADPTT
jgi:hypothetical protein